MWALTIALVVAGGLLAAYLFSSSPSANEDEKIGDGKEKEVRPTAEEEQIASVDMQEQICEEDDGQERIATVRHLIPLAQENLIPLSQVRDDVADAYKKEVKKQKIEMLLPYKNMCLSRKVPAEIVLIESDNVPHALSMEISRGQIKELVVGASSISNGLFSRKVKAQMLSLIIAQSAPGICTVYFVSKGKLESIHPSEAQMIADHTEKGISDLACHYLSKAGISAIRRLRKTGLQESDIGLKELMQGAMCLSRKVPAEIVLIESDNVPHALSMEIYRNQIKELVVGASSIRNGLFSRKVKAQMLSLIIAQPAPGICTVYVVSKGKLESIRPSEAQMIADHTEKGISDLACHYLSKAGISAIRRLRKTDNNRITKACGAVIANRTDELLESDTGTGASFMRKLRRVPRCSIGGLNNSREGPDKWPPYEAAALAFEDRHEEASTDLMRKLRRVPRRAGPDKSCILDNQKNAQEQAKSWIRGANIRMKVSFFEKKIRAACLSG